MGYLCARACGFCAHELALMTKHLPAILAILSTLAVEAGNVFAFHGTVQKVDSFIVIAIGTITTYLMDPHGGQTTVKPTA